MARQIIWVFSECGVLGQLSIQVRMRLQELMEVVQRGVAILSARVPGFSMHESRRMALQTRLNPTMGLEELGKSGTLAQVIRIVHQSWILSQLGPNVRMGVEELVKIAQLGLVVIWRCCLTGSCSWLGWRRGASGLLGFRLEGLNSTHDLCPSALGLSRLDPIVVGRIRLQVLQVNPVGVSTPRLLGRMVKVIGRGTILQNRAGVLVGGPGDRRLVVAYVLQHRSVGQLYIPPFGLIIFIFILGLFVLVVTVRVLCLFVLVIAVSGVLGLSHCPVSAGND